MADRRWLTVRSGVVAATSQAAGCRDTALVTLFLLGFAATFTAIGFALIDQPGCEGLCETAGLTLLYAGTPVSGLIGVVFGGVFFAWPLDATLWVLTGFLVGRRTRCGLARALGVALALVAVALLYGLVLSQLVELAAVNES